MPSTQTAPILSFDTAISISGFSAGSAAVGDSVTLSDVDKLTVQQTVADTMGLSRDDVSVISATVVTARRVLRSSQQIARRQLQSTSTISVLTQVVVSLLDFPEFAADPSGLYSSLVSVLYHTMWIIIFLCFVSLSRSASCLMSLPSRPLCILMH
jgi:hypothetical protein